MKKNVVKKKKLRAFHYRAKNADAKIVEGDIDAIDLKDAKRILREKGLFKIQCKARFQFPLKGLQAKRLTPYDVAIFARQMATMMQAGIPMVQSFDIVGGGSENPKMVDMVMDLKSRIEQGASFSSALKAYPDQFDQLFITLVDVGENAGTLELMLDRIATYKEKSESLKRKIKKALLYPTAIVIVAGVVTAILLIFVVPQFEELFSSFGAELPAFTQMVINISEWLQSSWWLLLLILFFLATVFKRAKKRSAAFREVLDRMMLRLPVIGPILNKAIYARFARTLATTFSSGLPLVEALNSVADAAGNVIYQNAILYVQEELSVGTQLNQAMKMTKKFPAMIIQLVSIGEQSGNLDNMLNKIADIYEEEVDLAVDGLSSLLEPIIMVVLGVLVGGLVVAMYLPIFQMGSVI